MLEFEKQWNKALGMHVPELAVVVVVLGMFLVLVLFVSAVVVTGVVFVDLIVIDLADLDNLVLRRIFRPH